MAELKHWVAAWAASPHGPYPAGNPSAQPDLSSVLPNPALGAANQSFRMIVRPSLWGGALRVRFCNAFGQRPLVITAAHVAVDAGGGGIMPGTAAVLTFGGAVSCSIPQGESLWSDPVAPAFLAGAPDNRTLAISFHIGAATGPMTWHAKALQTSYIASAGAVVIADETGLAFPFSTTSWFFIDAVDMDVPGGRAIVAFGDSLTDGTFSTLNGYDRWPDFLRRRLIAAGYPNVAVVNAGIGGNQVVGPARFDPAAPVPGGPSAVSRLARDVIGLSGLTTVIWLEGANDCSANGCQDPQAVIDGFRAGVAALRAARPSVRVIGATIPGANGSTAAGHGSVRQDECRRALNRFIREAGLFDAVIDFEAATTDAATGRLNRTFVPDSTIGSPGDGLHPNRAGYAAMAAAIDLSVLGL